MNQQYLGKKLTDAIFNVFFRAKESGLYNSLIKKLGISVSYNGMRDFANGLKTEIPLNALEKILSKYGYELKFYIAKKDDPNIENIQIQSAKDILAILEKEVTILEENKKIEKTKKDNLKSNKSNAAEKDSLNLNYVESALSTDFKLDLDVLKDLDIENDFSAQLTVKDLDEHINKIMN